MALSGFRSDRLVGMRRATLLACAFVGLAVAAQQTVTFFVNGTKLAPSDWTSVGEKTYVSTDALAAAGAEVTEKDGRISVQFVPNRGRLQADGIAGIVGEWASNETFRVRVTEVATIKNPFGPGPGVQLKTEVRNLTDRPLSLHGSGLDKVHLYDDQGQQLSFADSSFNGRYTSLPPAGGFENVVRFGDPSNKVMNLGKPDKLLILFRNAGAGKPLPNFRISLNP
jgi:hypothetical protein